MAIFESLVKKQNLLHKRMYAVKQAVIHYPSLKTVLMVENTLKNANVAISREELKRRLPKKMMHQTLNVILKYLEDSGKILDGTKGIVWIYNPGSKLRTAIEKGIEV